ncbi:MAG: hypothetical protein AAFX46_12255 [Cyanobacteria bacterium J06636_27]
MKDKPSHRFPKDAASEYRLNLDKIIATIDYSRCEKTSADAPDIPHKCANNPPTSERGERTKLGFLYEAGLF